MKEIKAKLVIFLGIPLIFPLVGMDSFMDKTIVGVCEKVLDGDTIIVSNQRIRLAGIDAPEVKQKSYDMVKIGELSRDFLRRRIEGKRVKVTYSKRGRYGRVIGNVWHKQELINDLMLANGMAILYGDDSSTDQRAIVYLAKLKRLGVFNTVGFLRPSIYRKTKR